MVDVGQALLITVPCCYNRLRNPRAEHRKAYNLRCGLAPECRGHEDIEQCDAWSAYACRKKSKECSFHS